MKYISDFKLPMVAGNRLLSLLKLAQSLPEAVIPSDHRRMVERNLKEYGRSTLKVQHTISLNKIHPCLKDIPDLVLE